MDDSSEVWQAVASSVSAAGHTVTLRLVQQLIAALRRVGGPLVDGEPSGPTPSVASSIDPKSEFLLPVDATGHPVSLPPDVYDLVQDALATTPALGTWLHPTPAQGVPTLCVARPLCHRIGLRHRTVQLILDHPTKHDLTFIQMRGLHKAEAPGAFDMPCAGHVVGLETVEATLVKELREELGLNLRATKGLGFVGQYESWDLREAVDFRNVELRAVYRARLRPEALDKIRFSDGEVAALALMSRRALRDLISQYPERVASGLIGSIGWIGAGTAPNDIETTEAD